MVSAAYGELFSAYGEDAWALDQDQLITFFRANDQTSADLGRRQATTFQTLASIAGHLESSKEKTPSISKPKARPIAITRERTPKEVIKKAQDPNPQSTKGNRDFGLTVRIEINLPAGADQETYDKIFRSIKENLINAG